MFPLINDRNYLCDERIRVRCFLKFIKNLGQRRQKKRNVVSIFYYFACYRKQEPLLYRSIPRQLIIVNRDSFPVPAQLTKFGPDTVNENRIDDHGITLTPEALPAINGLLASFSDLSNKPPSSNLFETIPGQGN